MAHFAVRRIEFLPVSAEQLAGSNASRVGSGAPSAHHYELLTWVVDRRGTLMGGYWQSFDWLEKSKFSSLKSKLLEDITNLADRLASVAQYVQVAFGECAVCSTHLGLSPASCKLCVQQANNGNPLRHASVEEMLAGDAGSF